MFLCVCVCVLGMGPMPWTVNSEIYPLWARSTGNACSAGVNWIFNVLVSLTFLHVAEFLTYYGKTKSVFTYKLRSFKLEQLEVVLCCFDILLSIDLQLPLCVV